MLTSLEWLKLRWISAKTDIIGLCDYLSRQAAGSKEWVNQQVNSEIEEAITIAANKLKRDYTITMKNHTFMLDWLCKQPGEEVKKIQDNSVYIEEDGHLYYTPQEGTPVKLDKNQQAQNAQEDEKRQNSLKTAETHPAFKLRSPETTKVKAKCEINPGIGAKGEESSLQTSKMPEEATVDMSCLQEDEEWITETIPVQGKRAAKYNSINPNRAAGRRQPEMRIKNNEATSIYTIRRLQQNIDHLSIAPIPDNVLTLEEAEEANIFAPATQNINGPEPNGGADHPTEAEEGDNAGRFLKLCFDKSPNMRLSTLIEQQRLDPALQEIITKCEKLNSVNLEGAEYTLKENVLIRKQTKGNIEHYQICLPAMVAYNLAMKLHTGNMARRQGRLTGPAPHGGPRKLYAMFSQRFHTKKLAKLCKHIHEACDICHENKTNHAKKRADMINSVYNPTGPGAAWAIDLLSLPKGCLLVNVDLFSRFTIAIPLYKEATSEHLWELFSTHILGVHGRPRVVIADNAPNISGNAIKQLCAMLSIELRTTPAYSPRSNLTELANKHILLALRLYHANYRIPYNKWRISLPSIVSGMNFSPFSGPLGREYGLSPAKLFFVNRDTLDPARQADMPYLEHIYKDYHAHVKHSIDISWAQQQLVLAQRECLRKERENKLRKGNKNFRAQKDDFKPGTIVLVDRHHKPGVMSKLRPRGQTRFIVVHTSDSCIYGRLWSRPDIERWASTKKYTQQNKDSISKMPVIKIPKERCKRDKTLHMWSSNTNPPDKQLMLLSQQDPEPISIEIQTYQDEDWLETTDKEGEDNPSTYFDYEDSTEQENTDENNRLINKIHLTSSISATELRSNGATENPKEAPKAVSRTRLHIRAKQVTINNTSLYITYNPLHQTSDKTEIRVRQQDIRTKPVNNKLERTFIYKKQNSILDNEDQLVQGVMHVNPGGKVIRIPTEKVYNRSCKCTKCLIQISDCRKTPCKECKRLSDEQLHS